MISYIVRSRLVFNSFILSLSPLSIVVLITPGWPDSASLSLPGPRSGPFEGYSSPRADALSFLPTSLMKLTDERQRRWHNVTNMNACLSTGAHDILTILVGGTSPVSICELTTPWLPPTGLIAAHRRFSKRPSGNLAPHLVPGATVGLESHSQDLSGTHSRKRPSTFLIRRI
jgi:hypothetical protein